MRWGRVNGKKLCALLIIVYFAFLYIYIHTRCPFLKVFFGFFLLNLELNPQLCDLLTGTFRIPLPPPNDSPVYSPNRNRTRRRQGYTLGWPPPPGRGTGKSLSRPNPPLIRRGGVDLGEGGLARCPPNRSINPPLPLDGRGVVVGEEIQWK